MSPSQPSPPAAARSASPSTSTAVPWWSPFLAGFALLAGGGCDHPAPTPRSPEASPTTHALSTTRHASPTPWFVESASLAGLDFHHHSGFHQRHLMPEINTGGVGLLDVDRDGLLDVFCVDGGNANPADPSRPNAAGTGNRLYRNLGGLRFQDITRQAGLDAVKGYGMGVACGDFDGDGWTDLYVLNLQANTLYRNRGDGTFEDVTSRAGVAGSEWSSSAAFFDVDRDGDLDLFVVNYVHWTPASEVACFSRGGVSDYCSPLSYQAPAMDRFYRNRGDGTFEDASAAYGLDRAFGNGLGIATGDYDHDGWTDVFVSNDAMPNQLWLNRGGNHFEEAATLRGCALNAMGIPRAGMGTVAIDLLDRGWLDLFVTHLVGEGNGLFTNHDGYFTDTVSPRGPMAPSRPFTGFGVGFRDFDHDGHLDLFVANGRARLGPSDLDPADPYVEPNTLLRGLGNGEFEEVLPSGGTSPVLLETSRGAAFGDLDNDGAEEIVVINKDGPLRLLHNQAPRAGRHWVGIDLQTVRGRIARNALVRLDAGGRSRWRQVQPNEGYASSSDPRLVFGLGLEGSPPRVIVRWPDGGETDFGPLAPDRYHSLVRPAASP